MNAHAARPRSTSCCGIRCVFPRVAIRAIMSASFLRGHEMNWGSYFFSFQGRINRAKLWLFIPIVIGIYIVYFILFSILFGSSLFAMLKGGPAGLAAGGASIGA